MRALLLMMQAAEKKSISGFFNEAVYPTGKLRQLVCHGFPTSGSRPLVSDASGRWRLSLFRYVCTLSKLAAFLTPGTRVLLPHLSTGFDRYTDTTTICDQLTVRTLTLNPSFFWEFFLPYGGLGVSCFQAVANSPLALWHAGVEPIYHIALYFQNQNIYQSCDHPYPKRSTNVNNSQ